ncbi:globin [Agilicoccus flavus]|uniref:globin n=1 Tax=Agilicoccus flavus TaxID=2775968 RepID=UPI001CF6C6D9|nr:globin [Agilicoccus flavus]
MTSPGPTPYELMGGHETLVRLVDGFYAGVAQDPELRALYPEEDLGPAAHRLTLFLEQYWGGPTTYSDTRGHPRLRMRHMPFAVTPTQRDRWLHHMLGSLDALALAPDLDGALRDYLTRAAFSLVNAEEGQSAPLERMQAQHRI